MINWFPLPRSLMESPIFIMSTPAEKLYLLEIASELNLRGPFYKADLEVAVTLGVSEDKIRRARREYMGLGWLLAKPGFRTRGRHLATRYFAAPGAERKADDFYAPLHRFTFESLLKRARARILTHADIVTYVYLTYLKTRNSSDGDWFFVTKRELRDLTGIAGANMCVAHLHDAWTFAGGSHLFESDDEYYRYTFSKWAICSDPSENKDAALKAQHYRAEIAAAVKAVRHPEPKRPARRTPASRV